MATAAAVTALKPLSAAPSLSKWFMFTEKNIAEGLIRELGKISRQGEKLGCIYLGPQRLVVATHPETAKEVITKPNVFKKAEDRRTENPLSRFYIQDGKFHPELVSSNDQTWMDLRKHFNPAFAMSALEKLIPMFVAEAEIFVRNCESGELEVSYATSQYALDCLGNAVLGRSFGAQTGEFKENYAAYLRVMASMGEPLPMFFPFLFSLPLPWNRKLNDAIDTVKGILETAVKTKLQERAANGSNNMGDSKTLLDSIIDAAEKDENFPRGSIVSNLWTFFIAGHDTTATSLAWLIDMFARYPEIQDRVRNEVKSVLGEMSQPPTLAQLDSLHYLDAVLKENLRLNPPVHNLLTRTAAEDTELGGYMIPKGTGISIAIQIVNTHPDSWTDPETFSPERFINEEKRKHKLYSWMPFSVGPRRCIGDKFSLLEQKCLLSKLLLNYNIKPLDENQSSRDRKLPLATSSFAFMFKQPAAFKVKFEKL